MKIEPIHEYKVVIVNKITNKEKIVFIKSANIELAYDEITKVYQEFLIKNIKYNWVL